MPAGTESVRVVVRCRPFNDREKKQNESSIIDIDEKAGSVSIANPKGARTSVSTAVNGSFNNLNESGNRTFNFDNSFGQDSNQIDIYNITARPIVDAVLEGYNGTIFAYGQTGTGKSFSMEGVRDDPILRGIIPNSFHHIFNHIGASSNKKFLVRASYLEIYNEEVRDLLSKNHEERLELKEHPEYGVYVRDLSNFVIKSIEEIEQIMAAGHKNRSVGATNMNEHSSRSHSIFTITIECSETGTDGEDHIRAGKLHLVDLAGSERQSKTGATGDRLKEATKINLSLSALGNCISALVDGKSTHIPYRDSKLTRLLQDSLGGNSKTLMIATVSPAAYNYEETLSTLRYANRAKNIQNKPKINEDPKDALLREYQEEVKRLMKLLESKKAGANEPANETTVTQAKVPKRSKREKISKTVKTMQGDDGQDLDDDDVSDDIEEDQVASINTEYENRKLQIEKEKQQMLASSELAKAEKSQLAKQLEEQLLTLEREKEERTKIHMQLQSIESKLLVGGVNIFERMSAQEKAIMEADEVIRQKRLQEREMEYQLEQQMENQQELEEHYTNLQEEVEVKTEKLQRVTDKINRVKGEIADLVDEYRAEKEELLETIRELGKELDLKQAVIDNFIPVQEREFLERRIVYNETKDDFEIISNFIDKSNVNPNSNNGKKRVSNGINGDQGSNNGFICLKRPISVKGIRRPMTQMARDRIMMGDMNPRFRSENILVIPLDMPDRTTYDLSEDKSISTSSPTAALDDDYEYDEEYNNGGDMSAALKRQSMSSKPPRMMMGANAGTPASFTMSNTSSGQQSRAASAASNPLKSKKMNGNSNVVNFAR